MREPFLFLRLELVKCRPQPHVFVNKNLLNTAPHVFVNKTLLNMTVLKCLCVFYSCFHAIVGKSSNGAEPKILQHYC